MQHKLKLLILQSGTMLLTLHMNQPCFAISCISIFIYLLVNVEELSSRRLFINLYLISLELPIKIDI